MHLFRYLVLQIVCSHKHSKAADLEYAAVQAARVHPNQLLREAASQHLPPLKQN